ncbi:hypothetical protein BGW37DRAFT_492879 [Umbelopsis sp. PMI_123]|nr:hypothetical protein BGW37DRAFT_492879 [Umbelopsis sp. PMI_123]
MIHLTDIIYLIAEQLSEQDDTYQGVLDVIALSKAHPSWQPVLGILDVNHLLNNENSLTSANGCSYTEYMIKISEFFTNGSLYKTLHIQPKELLINVQALYDDLTCNDRLSKFNFAISQLLKCCRNINHITLLFGVSEPHDDHFHQHLDATFQALSIWKPQLELLTLRYKSSEKFSLIDQAQKYIERIMVPEVELDGPFGPDINLFTAIDHNAYVHNLAICNSDISTLLHLGMLWHKLKKINVDALEPAALLWVPFIVMVGSTPSELTELSYQELTDNDLPSAKSSFENLQYMPRLHPNLNILKIHNIHFLGDEFLWSAWNHLPQLEHLHITFSDALTGDLSFLENGKGWKKLRSLNLTGCRHLAPSFPLLVIDMTQSLDFSVTLPSHVNIAQRLISRGFLSRPPKSTLEQEWYRLGQ